MQMSILDFFILVIFLTGLIVIIKLYNLLKFRTCRKCLSDEELHSHPLLIKNAISYENMLYLYDLIDKHLNIKKCLLNPEDTIVLLSNNDSFKLYEGLEGLVADLNEHKITLSGDERLIDILVKLEKIGVQDQISNDYMEENDYLFQLFQKN